jgi:hypothetical protein
MGKIIGRSREKDQPEIKSKLLMINGVALYRLKGRRKRRKT